MSRLNSVMKSDHISILAFIERALIKAHFIYLSFKSHVGLSIILLCRLEYLFVGFTRLFYEFLFICILDI